MESIRVNYVGEIGQYVNMDLSSDLSTGPITFFIDRLEADVADLADIGCFVSPETVLRFFDRMDFQRALASKSPQNFRAILRRFGVNQT